MGYPTGIDPVLPVSQTRVQATTLRTPLAGDVRIELTTLESKSSVIPFHQSPTILNLQSALFAMLNGLAS